MFETWLRWNHFRLDTLAHEQRGYAHFYTDCIRTSIDQA